MNLAEWVHRNGRRIPGGPALASGAQVHATWADFSRTIGSLARSFIERDNLRPGDRVAILMANRPEYLEALFGIWHAGCVAVPVNSRLHRDEVEYIANHSGARLVIVDNDHIGDAEHAAGADKVLQVATSDWLDRCDYDRVAVQDRLASDPAWLFYTSGTTGRPKGATLTNRNLMAMSLSYFADIDSIDENDAVVHAAPISHGSGLYGLPHIARGAVSITPSRSTFDGNELVRTLQHWTGVSFFAAPTMVRRLAQDPVVAKADFSKLKTVIYGGAPMYLNDLEEALKIFGPRFAQIYGQGESPMTITGLSKAEHADIDHPSWRQRMQSVGRPRTDVQVRVVNERGLDVATGDTGEVIVRGDVVMVGYWDQPDATAEALRDGWLHTGDLGSFDEHGYLTLQDRSKDLIISGGMNIYPREIEEILLTHPSVAECSVIGGPDPEWGEVVIAFVVTTGGFDADSEALDALCLDRIARYKRPKQYRFVESLPTSNYGKVLKRELRQQLLDG